MRGRKPHPTEVKLLRGNPGRRPLNLNEPKHETIDTAVPAELTDPLAQSEWSRIIATLSRGHVTTVDRSTLIGYCVKWAQWQTLEAAAALEPALVHTPSGYPIPNPLLGMANTAFKLMLKSAAELGITPSSRTRIVVAPKTDDPTAADEFTQFQRRRLTLAK